MLRALLLVAALLVAILGARFALMAADSREDGASQRAEGRLADCPSTHNCVSSRAADEAHRVEPLTFSGSPEKAMARLRELIESTRGARVAVAEPGYLRATYKSRIFGFVDDLELLVDPDAGVIHVRSASRAGRSDLGVNRRRVENLRGRFTAAG